MNTDVPESNAAIDVHLHAGRCAESELRVDILGRRCAGGDECMENRVVSGVAALQTSRSVVRTVCRRMVPVHRQPMVVLRMIVIAVCVRVQQRRQSGRRNQRRDEQQRQGAVHDVSL